MSLCCLACLDHRLRCTRTLPSWRSDTSLGVGLRAPHLLYFEGFSEAPEPSLLQRHCSCPLGKECDQGDASISWLGLRSGPPWTARQLLAQTSRAKHTQACRKSSQGHGPWGGPHLPGALFLASSKLSEAWLRAGLVFPYDCQRLQPGRHQGYARLSETLMRCFSGAKRSLAAYIC